MRVIQGVIQLGRHRKDREKVRHYNREGDKDEEAKAWKRRGREMKTEGQQKKAESWSRKDGASRLVTNPLSFSPGYMYM